jgi:competence protein CoiA
MALYAVDDDDLIYAGYAETGKIYWCMDCFAPVKRRAGKRAFPHFYHLKASPNCRLYSKTQDHLLAQVQLQKSFPPNVLQMEKPFIQINRVADLLWEKEKIVFEIQCSPITEKEVEKRMFDYHSIGYDVIWLLDDKRYNKRLLRPAEKSLRKQACYYISIKQGLFSEVYDQFEVFAEDVRVKKSKQMTLDLQKVRNKPKVQFDEKLFPKQVLQLESKKYVYGDRVDKALQSHFLTMQNWLSLETQLGKVRCKTDKFTLWARKYYSRFLAFLENLNR